MLQVVRSLVDACPLNDVRSVEREVEWLYAFDVHCNAYIPGFILLHVVQVSAACSLPPCSRCSPSELRSD